MSEQLTLAIDARTDPRTCPHREPYPLDGIWRCAAHDGCFVSCMRETCGEPPHCCFEPLDNSAGAVARRKRWMAEHKSEGTTE